MRSEDEVKRFFDEIMSVAKDLMDTGEKAEETLQEGLKYIHRNRALAELGAALDSSVNNLEIWSLNLNHCLSVLNWVMEYPIQKTEEQKNQLDPPEYLEAMKKELVKVRKRREEFESQLKLLTIHNRN